MLRSNNHNRDYLRSERLLKRKRRRAVRIFILIVILILLIIGGLIFVSRLDAFTVKNIDVEGNSDISTADIIAAANQDASSSWLYFFPMRDIALYPTNAIQTDLRARFPLFSSVLVHRTGLTSVKIQVIERRPRALWCDTLNQCYNIDDQGYIYSMAADVSTSSTSTVSDLIRFTGGLDGTSTPIGTTINSSSTFSDIASLLQGLKDQGLNPEEVDIRDAHEFSVKVNPGGDIIFSDERPLSESLANLSAALQSPAFKATSSPQNFEYIDTRFGNKIFFKLQK